jgi:hypothetical protein
MMRGLLAFSLGLAGSLGALASIAEAATLTVAQGEVLVSSGRGFRPVSGIVQLKKGDSVMAKADASASLDFGNGCVIAVDKKGVLTIGDLPPCSAHSAGAGAYGATQSPEDWKTDVITDDSSSKSVMPYVVGAAVIGGVAALVTTSGGSSGTTSGGGGGGGGGKPASP